MATLEEIVVQLTAETAGLRAEMQAATKSVSSATTKMDKAIEEFGKNSAKNTSFFQTAMATMTGFLGSQAVLGAFNAVKDAAGFFVDQLGEGIEAANAQEQALRRLGNSLALNGNYTATALASLKEFSDEMEKSTGIADDVVQSNLAVLSSLTKLDAQGLKAAQRAALDMSAALGIDLDTATQKVAKAINGQEEGLKKYGIQLELSTDKTRNLSIITDELGKSFGGAAAGQMNTFAGALKGVENSFGNFFEAVAESITQNPVFIAALRETANVLAALTTGAEASGTSLKTFLGNAFLFIADTLAVTITAVDQFVRIMEAGLRTLILPINAVADGIRFLGDILDGTKDQEAFTATKSQFEDLQQTIEGDTALSSITDKIVQIREAGARAFDGIASGANAAGSSLDVVNSKTKELTASQKAYREELGQWATGLADQNTALFATLDARAQMLEASRTGERDAEMAYWDEKLALMNERFAVEQQALLDARSNNLISEEAYQNAVNALRNNQAAQAVKVSQDARKAEEQVNKSRTADLKDTLGTIATLQSSSSKELAAIGKAAAISQATIDGYAAVQKALASAPPPFNFALAAAVGAATAVNVAKIAGVQGLKSGITEVPRSASGGNAGDNFPAMLQSGERVVDSQTNQDLNQFLANQNQGGSNVSINVTVMPGTGLNNEQIGNLIEQMNNYFNAGGLKLSGAT